MKRLTMYDKKSGHAEVARFPEFLSELRRTQPFREATELTLAMNKLAEYEDLEEQGLLVRLPCKVGDTVYRVLVNLNDIEPCAVTEFAHDEYGTLLKISSFDGVWIEFVHSDNIGKTVFLTREEAEVARRDGNEEYEHFYRSRNI